MADFRTFCPTGPSNLVLHTPTQTSCGVAQQYGKSRLSLPLASGTVKEEKLLAANLS